MSKEQSDDLMPDRSDDDICAEVITVGLPARWSSRITVTLAERLEARNAEVAELKRLLKWAWDNAIGRLESVETDEGLTVRLIRFPNRLERDAIEKIVGEK